MLEGQLLAAVAYEHPQGGLGGGGVGDGHERYSSRHRGRSEAPDRTFAAARADAIDEREKGGGAVKNREDVSIRSNLFVTGGLRVPAATATGGNRSR
jgi:hypothetical protein